MLKTDPLTQEKFQPKRINQRFASAYNRIMYHNHKSNELRSQLAYINRPLLRNVKILNEEMLKQKDAIFHKQYLIGRGFDFDVLTHVEPFEGLNQFAIYNYLVIPCGNEKIRIVRYD